MPCPNLPRPGSSVTLAVHNGIRIGTLLARVGNQVLVEYLMPGGTTGLVKSTDSYWEQRENGPHLNAWRRVGVGYQKVAKKWLSAMQDCQITWIRNPMIRKSGSEHNRSSPR